MDGIHDLGGKYGFGGSLAIRDEASFHEPWERRVWGLTSVLLGSGCFNVDEFRHAVERMDPEAYLRDGYWGRWLSACETMLDDVGGKPEPGRVADGTAQRDVADRPRFAVGDRVRTRAHGVPGHTRLPAYARGRVGVIALLQGGWVLPDTNAHGAGECPEHVYAVRFEGSELWGEAAEAGTSVTLDLFERYLEPQ